MHRETKCRGQRPSEFAETISRMLLKATFYLTVCMSLKGFEGSRISEITSWYSSLYVRSSFDDLDKLVYYTIFYSQLEFFKVIKRVVIYTENIFT